MTEPLTYEVVLAEAITILTEAARLTRRAGPRTGPEQREPIDFAEFVTLAVAGATANIGGIEEVLAGRPGSWEAESVRSMLISTVGKDETYLMQHRTEPLTIVVNVDDLLNDLGYWELYDQAEDELARREQEVGIPSITYSPGAPDFDAEAYLTAAAQLEPATEEQEAARGRIEELRDKLDQQREQDCAAYGEAFKANVLAVAAELLPQLRVPVEVRVELHWQDNAGSAEAAGPAWRLWERARAETPLPGSGIPLKNYPLHVSVPDVERAAGRDPLARVEGPS